MTDNVDTEEVNETMTEAQNEYEKYERARDDDRSIEGYVQWSLFVILLLVMLVATFRFYFATSTAIDQFVTDRYRSIFQAGFNLAILLVSGLGLSLLVRNMR